MKRISAAFLVTCICTSAFAQTATVGQAYWWASLADEAVAALAAVATAAVAALAPVAFSFVRSKSRLAAVLVSQAMLDKLVQGIQNQIRAEAEKLQDRIPGGRVPASGLSLENKKDLAANVAPKIETAFKETLAHFDKKPGSQEVKDMILGQIEPALKVEPAPPVVVAGGAKVREIPAVMQRS